jgi:hypothetical protein
MSAADGSHENKLKNLQAGAKFKAIYDLTFSSGTQYISFKDMFSNNAA